MTALAGLTAAMLMLFTTGCSDEAESTDEPSVSTIPDAAPGAADGVVDGTEDGVTGDDGNIEGTEADEEVDQAEENTDG